jgi:hypothetical protein
LSFRDKKPKILKKRKKMNTQKTVMLVSLLISALLSACGLSPAEQAGTATQAAADNNATLTAQAPTGTATFTPSPTASATPTLTPTSTPTPTPTITNTPEPTLTTKQIVSSMALTLDDLSPGFEVLPAEQILPMEQAYGEGASGFGFQDPRSSQVVMGVLMPVIARVDQKQFDSLMPQMLQSAAVGVGADSNAEPLSVLDEVGEAREGTSAVAKIGSLSLRYDIVVFRRGEVGALIFLVYPDGDEPAMTVADLSRVLDERIQSSLEANPLPPDLLGY